MRLLFRSSLIRVHTVCRYAKNRFEKFARIFSRRHKQMTFSDAVFLGALRANFYHSMGKFSRLQTDIFLLFSKKIGFDISKKSQSLFSGKNMKNLLECHLLKMLPIMLSVKELSNHRFCRA